MLRCPRNRVNIKSNQTSATDARSETTTFTYDVMDKLAGVTAPGSHTGYAYDKNYNLASVTNARSVTTSYTYTANDLLEAVTDPLSRTWTTYGKMAQNLVWATGYNVIAIPLAASVLAGAGILLSPVLGGVLMSASTIIVAVNARTLRTKER